ncbi:MAG: hypothetical protein AAF802_16520 [Planctomycetota bacterium]
MNVYPMRGLDAESVQAVLDDLRDVGKIQPMLDTRVMNLEIFLSRMHHYKITSRSNPFLTN